MKTPKTLKNKKKKSNDNSSSKSSQKLKARNLTKASKVIANENENATTKANNK